MIVGLCLIGHYKLYMEYGITDQVLYIYIQGTCEFVPMEIGLLSSDQRASSCLFIDDTRLLTPLV